MADSTNSQIAWCLEKRAHTIAKLEQVKGGITVHVGRDGVPLKDVTPERVARWQATVDRLDAFIAACGGPTRVNGRKPPPDVADHRAALRRIAATGRGKLRESGMTDEEIDAEILRLVGKLNPKGNGPI
jgi:hypothetical protein